MVVNSMATILTTETSAAMRCCNTTIQAGLLWVSEEPSLLLRNGSGGHLQCPAVQHKRGIEIEDKADEVEDAYERWEAGDLTLENIVVTGGVDALDYDGDAADGDDLWMPTPWQTW